MNILPKQKVRELWLLTGLLILILWLVAGNILSIAKQWETEGVIVITLSLLLAFPKNLITNLPKFDRLWPYLFCRAGKVVCFTLLVAAVRIFAPDPQIVFVLIVGVVPVLLISALGIDNDDGSGILVNYLFLSAAMYFSYYVGDVVPHQLGASSTLWSNESISRSLWVLIGVGVAYAVAVYVTKRDLNQVVAIAIAFTMTSVYLRHNLNKAPIAADTAVSDVSVMYLTSAIAVFGLMYWLNRWTDPIISKWCKQK